MPLKKVPKADAQIGHKWIGSIVDETASKCTCCSQWLSAGLAPNEEPKEQEENENRSEDELVDAAKEGGESGKVKKVGGHGQKVGGRGGKVSRKVSGKSRYVFSYDLL